jgi:hypothetical protein
MPSKAWSSASPALFRPSGIVNALAPDSGSAMHEIREEQMRATQLFRGALALALVASATGCIRRAQPGDRSVALTAEATARITNNNWLDVNVYASRAGSRQRLGTVSGQNTEIFRLPRDLIEARGVRLFIDPIGSPQSYQTEIIPVGPGQLIDLVVQPRLAMSHYSVLDP